MSRPETTSWRHAFGPGLLMAGAAIGVSHLVQSTRAGAEYGLSLLGLVLLTCLLKYPFLEFGPRYAAATGESMVAGYRRLGRLAFGLFAAVTLGSAVIIQAGVTIVTAGLLGLLFGLDWSITWLSLLTLLACAMVLLLGHYRGLDLSMKVIMAALSASTLAAVALALGTDPDWSALDPLAHWERIWTATGFAFVLALLGWMPIPLDVAAWHSLWTLERARQTGRAISVPHAVRDFQFGYLGATALAGLFVLLGALIMYSSGAEFPGSSVGFAGQLIELYAAALGEWSRPLIAIAALTTMFSTTLVVSDGYPRVIRALLENLDAPRSAEQTRDQYRGRRYFLTLTVIFLGALTIIHFFGRQFTLLIDFATTLSFLAAPLVAWLSLSLVTSSHMPAAGRPGRLLIGLAWAGQVFLIAFCLIWLGWRLH